MEKLNFPWMYIGPAGSGKTQSVRKMLAESLGVTQAEVYPKDIRMFKVNDDYECRVYCSPYHFEIDIPDMSMQDKQILVEVLSMLFSAGDVFSGLKTNKRKIVLLRRAHNLSLAAAIRLRWIMETRVCPDGGTGMIWLCAREITGSLSLLEDLFVRVRISSPDEKTWIAAYPQLADAYNQLDGRMDRAFYVTKWGLDKALFPRTIANCYEDIIIEILRGCIKASIKKIDTPPLILALWIRERVYDMLGLCQTGIEFLDGYSLAIENALLKGYCTGPMFKSVIAILGVAEPNTSYRNPISLEKILLDICIILWQKAHLESLETLTRLESALPVEGHGTVSTRTMENTEDGVDDSEAFNASTTKKSASKGATKAKKRSPADAGNTIVESATTKSRAKTTKPRAKAGSKTRQSKGATTVTE
jgi:hypothetical protein